MPARNAWPVPAGFDIKLASAIPVPFGTADDCLFEFGHLKAGETVLVQAGASGVGVAAIQLAKRAGATVLATASSDERLERLKPLGLDHGINYRTGDVVKSVMKLTDSKGVNLVVDPVGGATLQSSILSLAYRGRISMVGAAGREAMTVDVSSLMAGNRSLTGVFLGAEIATDRAHNMIQRLVDEAASGEFKVVIDRDLSAVGSGRRARLHRKQASGRPRAADSVVVGSNNIKSISGGHPMAAAPKSSAHEIDVEDVEYLRHGDTRPARASVQTARPGTVSRDRRTARRRMVPRRPPQRHYNQRTARAQRHPGGGA